ncbi:MAG TPA: CBS domain-containing protein [Actinomycetota bacterium]|nr:CBS domain-containing protein [Actinomycetota bacterium]
MGSSIRLFRVRGVEIGVHWSWLLIFALIAWSLGSALFPATHPGLAARTYLAMGVVAAVLFFGSILLHELAHAFMGIRQGVRMEGITLWLLGGVARFSGTPGSPGAEFRMTVVGPVTSIVLGGAFLGLSLVAARAGWPVPVRAVADHLGRINLILAVFNLVPALPLDGGRVLRSWLWRRQRSFVAATVAAARAGSAFGWLLIGVAVLGFLGGEGAPALWLALLGWFLLQASEAEAAAAVVQAAFRGRRVSDVMTPDPQTVDPDMDLARFVDVAAGPGGHSTYPVVEEGRLVGAITLRRAGSVAGEERSARRVRDAMVPASELPTVPTDAAVADALPALAERGRVFVVEDGRVAGIVSAADVARAVEARRLRSEEGRPRRGPGLLVWLAVAAAMVAVAGFLYHPPVVVVEPAPAIDVTDAVDIRGVPTDPIEGRYLVAPVSVSRPNGLEALLAAFDPNRDVLPLSAMLPSDVPPQRVLERQRAAFQESRVIAAAAAARAAGMEVTVEGSGARVVDVMAGSPAEGLLRPGDVIVEIDGRPVATADDLRGPLTSSPAGTTFRLEVERADTRRRVAVRTARVTSGGQSFVGLGVLLDTRGLSVDLPFHVSFPERPEVAGPSGGLVYALLIADLLDPADLAGGRVVAATGTVDLEGDVGPVGGLAAKAESARASGADILLVPAGGVGGLDPEDLTIRGVATLEEAIGVLGGRA